MPITHGYRDGDWKAQCFRCGKTIFGSEARKQWQGYYVCPEHWEPRHPQDFVRGVTENPAAPWSQPDNWTYVGPAMPTPPGYCTPEGSSAIPAYSVPGCLTPGKLTTVIPT